MSVYEDNYADMPKDQVDYFGSETRTPLKPAAGIAPQTEGLACPHEAQQNASMTRGSSVGGAQRPSANPRSDIFEKYKQYFSSGTTPVSPSLNRSERSVSQRSDLGGNNPASWGRGPAAANQPAAAKKQPSYISETSERSVDPPQRQRQPVHEPRQHGNDTSVRSTASSVKPQSSVQNNSAMRAGPQKNYQPGHYEEHPLSQPRPQQARNTGPGGDRASQSTRASEPQVVSCDPYHSHTDRANSEISDWQNEHVTPNPTMIPPQNLSSHQQRQQVYNDNTQYKDNSVDPRRSEEGRTENSYEQPPAAQVKSNQPPRRPSYSRISRSTASVATVSSAHRDERPQYDDNASDMGRRSYGDNNSVADDENYSFKPAINARSRNLAARRPDYGQNAYEQAHSDADYVRKGTASKNKYSDVDQRSEDIVMPSSEPRSQSPQPMEGGVFSRLYTDAQRYNEERAERERRLELQRMRDRGEISDDDEAPEVSQETAHPGKEDGDEQTGRKKSVSQKRHVDFEAFDRLSKPTNITRKLTQVREEEEQRKNEEAARAQEERAKEMEFVAKLTWNVPAPTFTFADLQRQNALFVA